MNMKKVEYISCSSCGYEGFDVDVLFVRTDVNIDVYKCPKSSCKQETTNVVEDSGTR